MEEIAPFTQETSLAGPSPTPKRRKLRKGTQSCWECKRRKARCTFSGPAQEVCEGCRRRGTDCISQEVADQPPPPGSNRHLVDRLGQVEVLVQQLLRSSGRVDHGLGSPSRPESRKRTYRDRPGQSRSPAVRPGRTIHARTASNTGVPQHNIRSGCVDANYTHGGSPLRTPMKASCCSPLTSDQETTPGKHDDLCQALRAAWPSSQDLDAILSIPVETSSIIRIVTCNQVTCSQVADPAGSTKTPSARTMLQLPPPGSHPTLIARKLLTLATFLQGIPFSSARALENLGTSCEDIMSRAVKAAHSVTSDDELVASVEGIECIMLESLYENYAGHLRRSWLASRRAVMMAQMVGLDRGVKPASLDGATTEPDRMWFRLVQLDRYLCLMLGLPQSALEDGFADPETLDSCAALERMHRLSCVANGRILRRDRSGMLDPETTSEIDKLLQEAFATMPPHWWVPPTLSSCSGHMDRIRETLRFHDHFLHYHLLLQLHLPYLLHSTSEPKYEYNRMTAVAASREILSRLLSFRALHSIGYYCRAVDFITFIASTALCLAYMNEQRRRGAGDAGVHYLVHQRMSDRGLLEQTLLNMQTIAAQHNDDLVTRVATLLQNLLAIEADVAAGGRYTTTLGPESKVEQDLGCLVKLSDDANVLNIHLPHFLTIKIEREGPQPWLSQTNPWPEFPQVLYMPQGQVGNEPQSGLNAESEGAVWGNPSLPQLISFASDDGLGDSGVYNEDEEPGVFGQDAVLGDWSLQDIDVAFLDGLVEGNIGLETPAG